MWLQSAHPPRIYIHDLSLMLGIGCTEAERSSAQELRLSLVLELPGAPQGSLTDNLDDTICYHKICNHLVSFLRERPYQLIEKLAYEAYQEVKKLVPRDVLIQITVHKVNPPIEHLAGGIRYVFGDPIQ